MNFPKVNRVILNFLIDKDEKAMHDEFFQNLELKYNKQAVEKPENKTYTDKYA